MGKSLISVIVPIYNVSRYLERCMESLLHQTYKNIEIIMVDDGSSDDCGKNVTGMLRKNQGLRLSTRKCRSWDGKKFRIRDC